jgi:hypothetical protein
MDIRSMPWQALPSIRTLATRRHAPSRWTLAGQSDDLPDAPEATEEHAGNMVEGRPLITNDRLLSSTLTMFIEELLDDEACCGHGCGGIYMQIQINKSVGLAILIE